MIKKQMIEAICYKSRDDMFKLNYINKLPCLLVSNKNYKNIEESYVMYFHSRHLKTIEEKMLIVFQSKYINGIFCQCGDITKVHSYNNTCLSIRVYRTD